MSRMIKMTTDNLKELLGQAQKYKHFIVYDGDDNTDGEDVWHCDVELADELEDIYYDTSREVWSFDEVK